MIVCGRIRTLLVDDVSRSSFVQLNSGSMQAYSVNECLRTLWGNYQQATLDEYRLAVEYSSCAERPEKCVQLEKAAATLPLCS